MGEDLKRERERTKIKLWKMGDKKMISTRSRKNKGGKRDWTMVGFDTYSSS